MSVFRDAWDAAGSPTLFSVFGESVTHYPLGAAAGTTVSAVFEDESGTAEMQVGRDGVRRAKLTVDDSVSVTLRDGWLINGERWSTKSFTAYNGMIVLVIERKDRDRRDGVPGQ